MLITEGQLVKSGPYWTPYLVRVLLGEPDHTAKQGRGILRLYCGKRIEAAEKTIRFKLRKKDIDKQLRERIRNRIKKPLGEQLGLFSGSTTRTD